VDQAGHQTGSRDKGIRLGLLTRDAESRRARATQTEGGAARGHQAVDEEEEEEERRAATRR